MIREKKMKIVLNQESRWWVQTGRLAALIVIWDETLERLRNHWFFTGYLLALSESYSLSEIKFRGGDGHLRRLQHRLPSHASGTNTSSWGSSWSRLPALPHIFLTSPSSRCTVVCRSRVREALGPCLSSTCFLMSSLLRASRRRSNSSKGSLVLTPYLSFSSLKFVVFTIV